MSTDVFIKQVRALWRNRERAPEDFRDHRNKDGTIDRVLNPMSGKVLTDAHVRVAIAIRQWTQPDCKQSEIAAATRCHVRTVQRATNILAAFKLLSWDKQFIVAPTWRARIANVYHCLYAKTQETLIHLCPGNVSPPVGLARWIAKKAAQTAEKAQQMEIFEERYGAPKLANAERFPSKPMSIPLAPTRAAQPYAHDTLGTDLLKRRRELYASATRGTTGWQGLKPA